MARNELRQGKMTVPNWVGIDWGTTHRRAWLFTANAGGRVARRVDDDQGLVASAPHFAASLAPLLQTLGVDLAESTLVMAGMVGAATGWQEVPYLDATTPLATLPQHLQQVIRPDAPPRAWIVPGVRWRGDSGMVDVMRGEETQIYGAMQLLGARSEGWFLLPGTHSKWVRIESGRVDWLRTYLSGELFALLRDRGTLSALMRAPVTAEISAHERSAFEQGFATAGEAALSHALFAARARAVTGALEPGSVAAFVTGALFGAEWRDMAARLRGADCVRLIGDAALCARHAECAALLGLRTETIDAEAAQRAAWEKLRAEGPQ